MRSTGANGLTATSAAAPGTPGYNAPDSAISAITSPDLAYGSTTYVVAIAGGSSIDQYYVYNNAGNVNYGGRTGNGNINITHGVAAGGAATFRVYARRPVAVGGDNAFDNTGTTFEVEVFPNNVVLSVSNDNPELANVTATLSVTGGQGGTIQYAKTSYGATTTYAQTRGTTVTYYARSVGSNGLISQVSFVNHSVGYIAPATYTVSDFTVPYDTAQHFDLLTSFPANDNYEVLTGGYTGTVRGSQSGGGGSSSVIAVTNINNPGEDVTYYIRGYRAVAVGGDGLYDNMDTYIVGELPQASTVLETFTDQGTESTSGTFRVKVTPGAGASSVQISLTSSSANLQNNDTDLANVVRTGDRIYTRTTAANNTVQDGFLDTPTTYLAPNTGSIAGTSSTIGPDDTTGSTTVSGVLSGHTYVVKKNNGDNDKPRSAIFTANGPLTISDNGVTNPPGLPLLGETFFYEFLVYRNTAAGGAGAPAVDEDWVETNRQFSIKRAPDAPTNILTSVPATQSATTSVILNAIGGETGGTVQVSDDNVSWFANGSEFQNKTRGTEYTFYARRLGTNNVTSDLYTHPAYEIPYIAPDPSVTATDDTIAFNATTASTTVGDVNTNNNYAVRVENGSTNLGTVDSSVTSPAVITFSSSLPTVGNSITYEIFAARRVETGGSGAYIATDNTFTVTRNSEPVTAPTDLVMSTAATASATPLVTATASGGSGGTLQVSIDNSNWFANGTTFTRTRGTSYTFYARREGSGSVSASYSEGYTPPYLAPDAAISAITSPDLAYGSTTHVVAIAGGNASDEYFVYNNAGTVNYGSRTGNGNITITHGVAAGGAATFRVYARKPVAVGGDNAFDDTGTTFEIEVFPNNVVLSVSNDNPNSASVTATLSATGGQGGTIEYAKTSYSATTTYAQARGTTVTYYARSVGSNGLISQVDFVNHTVGYIAPDSSITLNPTSLTLTIGTTQWTLEVANGNSLDTYQIRDSSGTEHESRTGNGNITVTDVPANSEVYTAFVKRVTASGGDNTYITTGSTITITIGGAGILPPVISSIGIVDIDGTNATATVNLSSTGSGGTLKYRQHTTSTPPATGWQTSNSFTQPYSTTRYYFASQDEDTAGAYDTIAKTLGVYNAGVYGLQVFNTAGDLTLDTTYRVPGSVVVGSSSVNSGTTGVGTPASYTGTSGTISFPGMTPTNETDFDVWILDNIPAGGAWSVNEFTINRGTGSFTVTFKTDTSNYTLNFNYIGMRF